MCALESSQFQVCLDVTARFPEPDWTKLPQTAMFYKGMVIDTTANLNYGSSCANHSSVRLISSERSPLLRAFHLNPDVFAHQISFKGNFTHTHEDEADIEANALGNPASLNRARSNRLRYLYGECAKYQKEGILVNYYCHKYLYHTSRLGRLTQDVVYKNFKPVRPALCAHFGFFL